MVRIHSCVSAFLGISTIPFSLFSSRNKFLSSIQKKAGRNFWESAVSRLRQMAKIKIQKRVHLSYGEIAPFGGTLDMATPEA